jgi:hypothetical protein
VGVTDHLIEGLNCSQILGQLSPDLHPVTVLSVDALSTNLELNGLDHSVTNVVQPTESTDCSVVGCIELDRWENHLDVGSEHQIGVTVDDGCNALVEVSLAVEGHLNGLHCEVCVTLEQNLPESDLGVT